MNIVSSQIIRIINKQGGRFSVYEQHTDDLGKIHDRRYQCAADYDKDAALAQYALDLPAQFLENEAKRVQRDIENGVNGSRSAYLDRIGNIRAVVKGAMNLPADKALIIAAIGDTVTDAELDQAFDTDTTILIRNRIASVLALQTALISDQILQVEL